MDDAGRIVEQHLSALLHLCRQGRGGASARELAARTIATQTERAPVSIEAGVLRSLEAFEEDYSVTARLLARGFESVTFAPGVTVEEILGLAESLASDDAPVRETAYVGLIPLLLQVDAPMPATSVPAAMTVLAAAAPARELPDRRDFTDRRRPLARRFDGINRRRSRDRRESGERRLPNQQQQRTVVERFAQQFAEASEAGAWIDAMHAAQALVGIEVAVPQARRGMHRIAVRRMITPAVLHKFAAIGLTREDEREGVARIFRWMGLDGADVLLPLVLEHDRPEPRRFLHSVLSVIPDAHTLVAPILQSNRAPEVRHAIDLLGAMRAPGYAARIRPFLDHPADEVRLAAVQALAEFPVAEMAVHLSSALASPEEVIRDAAIDGIARRRIGALAMPLMAVLGRETRRDGRLRIIRALGQLGSDDASQGLARIALTRQKLFGGGVGFPIEERLEAVSALRLSRAPNATATLERLVRDGDGKIRPAAAGAVADRRGTAIEAAG